MFIGHFALGFAAKRFTPAVSLAVLFAAAQLADLIWPLLVAIGLEQVRIDPANTAFTPLDFVSYPYSHSLALLVLWGGLFAWFARGKARSATVLLVIWVLVASHWVLDVLTHRGDMPLYPGGPEYGFGLWNSVRGTMALELLMYAVGLWIYIRATRARDQVGHWAFRILAFSLAVIYLVSVGSIPPSVTAVWVTALVGGALILVWSWWADRHREGRRRFAALLVLVVAPLISAPAVATAQSGTSPADRELARGLFREIIEIPTTETDSATTKVAQLLADHLVAAGLPQADVQVVESAPHVGSLVAWLRGRDASLRPILLIAHLDVVPARREDWSRDPWTLTEAGGWFYGRGTSDNKNGATVLVTNFIRLKRAGWQPQRSVVLALTGDEETTGASIQWLLQHDRELARAEMAFNADAGSLLLRGDRPSLFTVQAAEKVYMDLTLEASDVGGHSSLPSPRNPIYALSSALLRIAGHSFPANVTDVARLFFERSAIVESGQLAADLRSVSTGRGDAAALERLSRLPFYNARLRTTCVATRVDAGHANNALPQLARAVLNCRILPGESPAAVEATIRELAGKNVAVAVLEAAVGSPPSPVTGDVLATIERVVAEQWPGVPVSPAMEAGATDGLYVRRAGIPTYGVSAMTEDPSDVRAHGKDERVSVEGFYAAMEFWYRLIRTFSGR